MMLVDEGNRLHGVRTRHSTDLANPRRSGRRAEFDDDRRSALEDVDVRWRMVIGEDPHLEAVDSEHGRHVAF